jgi:hypothetical protein
MMKIQSPPPLIHSPFCLNQLRFFERVKAVNIPLKRAININTKLVFDLAQMAFF